MTLMATFICDGEMLSKGRAIYNPVACEKGTYGRDSETVPCAGWTTIANAGGDFHLCPWCYENIYKVVSVIQTKPDAAGPQELSE